jgi:hypothetical protein
MTSLFLFSLILGGGLLAVSLLGDIVGGDVDVDTDVDVDVDVDLDADLDADVAGEPDLVGAMRIFTIRNLTYFLFGFGGVGYLVRLMDPGLSTLVATVAALAGGVMAAGIATVVFGWLKATDAGWQAEEASFVGCEARVVLPVGHGRVGQVVVRRGDREHELRALPFDAAAVSPETWREVVVIDMEGGTARVGPMDALAPAEDGPAALS